MWLRAKCDEFITVLATRVRISRKEQTDARMEHGERTIMWNNWGL